MMRPEKEIEVLEKRLISWQREKENNGSLSKFSDSVISQIEERLIELRMVDDE